MNGVYNSRDLALGNRSEKGSIGFNDDVDHVLNEVMQSMATGYIVTAISERLDGKPMLLVMDQLLRTLR